MLESKKKKHLYLMRLLTTNNIKLHHYLNIKKM